MLKLQIGIFFIIFLFTPTIQQYSDDYCAKYVATFPLTIEACIDISDSNNQSSIIYKIMNETNVIIESFPNNNCSGQKTFTLTYSSGICRNNMIITYDDYTMIRPILQKTSKKENWNEYIILSGMNFSSIKSFKIPKKVLLSEEIIKYIDSPILVISDFFIGISAFLFTITFFIVIME
jgi:hypothetical protein